MEFTIDARDAGEGLLTVQILVSDPSPQTGINLGWNVFRANAENLRREPSETSCDQQCVAIHLMQCETSSVLLDTGSSPKHSLVLGSSWRCS